MKTKKKKPVTLIEIMIVILLIGIIGGALAFNMRGSVDEGKAFKTRQNIARIEDILLLKSAESGNTLSELIAKKKWKDHVLASPLVKGDQIIKDGWNNEFTVTMQDDNLLITTDKYTAYLKKHSSEPQK